MCIAVGCLQVLAKCPAKMRPGKFSIGLGHRCLVVSTACEYSARTTTCSKPAVEPPYDCYVFP